MFIFVAIQTSFKCSRFVAKQNKHLERIHSNADACTSRYCQNRTIITKRIVSRAIAMHCLLMHFTIQAEIFRFCYKISSCQTQEVVEMNLSNFIVMENFLEEKKRLHNNNSSGFSTWAAVKSFSFLNYHKIAELFP